MPVSGLVITLCDDAEDRRALLAHLRRDPRVTLGEVIANHVPVVTDTQTISEARDLYEAIQRLDGVMVVAVITLDFSDQDEEAPWTAATS